MTGLRWLTSTDDVSLELRAELTACWRDVANAGGAVGFAQQLPVTDAVVRPALDATVDALGPTSGRLLVAERDGVLVGWLVLLPATLLQLLVVALVVLGSR